MKGTILISGKKKVPRKVVVSQIFVRPRDQLVRLDASRRVELSRGCAMTWGDLHYNPCQFGTVIRTKPHLHLD